MRGESKTSAKKNKLGRKRIEGLVPLTINLPSNLKERLVKEAKKQRTSLSHQITVRLEKTFLTEVDENDDTLSANLVIHLEKIKGEIDNLVNKINTVETRELLDDTLNPEDKSFFYSFKGYLDSLVDSERKLLLTSISHAMTKGNHFLDVILKAIVVDRNQTKEAKQEN